MGRDNRKFVTWKRVVSSTLTQPATPMVAVIVGVDTDTGEFWECRTPVLGVRVSVVERYSRAARGEYDLGYPHDPPTMRSLREEGYTFDDSDVEMSYVVHFDGMPTVAEDAKCDNTELIFHAAGDDPSEVAGCIAEAKDRLARIHGLTPPSAPTPPGETPS